MREFFAPRQGAESPRVARRTSATFPPVTFGRAFDAYIKAGGEARFAARLLPYLGCWLLSEIDERVIGEVKWLLYRDASPATLIRQLIAPVSAILNFGVDEGWCKLQHFKRPALPSQRVRWLLPAEIERLIVQAAPHLRPLLIFRFGTGAHDGEALHLSWSRIDLARREVEFPATEKRESRPVPLSDWVLAALENLPHRDGAVFRRPLDGQRYGWKGRGRTSVKSAFGTACREAGISDFTPRDIRSTWAVSHYAAHRDIKLLVQLGGWADERLPRAYTRIGTAILDKLKADLLRNRDAMPAGSYGASIFSCLLVQSRRNP